MSSAPADAAVGTISPPAAPPAPSASPPPAHRWWALVVIGLAQLMVVLDATIVNIALPSAQQDLGFSNDDRQWVVTAYSLAFGSLLLLGGRLADLFGRKTTLLIGLIGFAASSALAGAAGGFTLLVVGRALQGAFGAMLAPSALSLLTTTFTDPKERGRAFGVFGAIAGSGGAVGLLLGGVLTEHLNWRWTLYVNLVIAVLAVAGALLFIRRPAPAQRPKLDLLGTLLVSSGLFCIVFGFSNAETYTWSDPMCWGFLAGGVVLLLAFIGWQTRAAHPLLPLRVFADRNRSASYLMVFATGAGMFGIFLFLTYYLQQILGYTPVKTGLAFLPMILMLMLLAQLSINLLMPKIGPKVMVPIGTLFAAGGLAWLTRIDLSSSYSADILPPLLLIGAGIGMVMPPAMSLATLGVAPADQGVASATVNTMQQVGGSIGTALFSTMATTAAGDYVKDHGTSKPALAQAAVHSYAIVYWWAAGLFAIGFLIAVFLYRKGRPLAAAPAPEPAAAHTPGAPDDLTTAAPQEQPAAELPAAGPAAAPLQTGVRGRVLGDFDAPVASAVTLIDQAGRQVARAVPGPDGSYALSAPYGRYVLVASAPDRKPEISELVLGTEPVEHNVRLAGTGGLFGTVSGTAGPIEGALLVVTDAEGSVVDSAMSAADGGYRLPALPPAAYTFTAGAEGHQPYAALVTVTGSAPTRHDAALTAAATVRGTVKGPQGEPVDDALVTLLDTAGNVVARHTTGPDGVYTFTGLTGLDYTLIAAGYPPAASQITVPSDAGNGFDVLLGHSD
ncbi:DHA2 family efflux MFS transporter permease subunit [Streptomyces sp. SID10853]|uniref:MFS transporter n=1 Tax=Streptomyces sp. SID10853 TaxID=2706028 RepID=UPI0013C23BEB|nr:MFS transporter [Streptomyces sp. SID10853]NDZ81250.1 DHA2 family efflux MFS transporter permease subunit [Streptomyces sp. SID10853]